MEVIAGVELSEVAGCGMGFAAAVGLSGRVGVAALRGRYFGGKLAAVSVPRGGV
jgi:hypothetical protein